MAQEEKKNGFFARFRKRPAVASAPAAPPVKSEVESLAPSVAPKPVLPPPAATLVPAELSVDTVAAIDQFCKAMLELTNSQIKVIELALTTLAGSIDKAVARTKAEK